MKVIFPLTKMVENITRIASAFPYESSFLFLCSKQDLKAGMEKVIEQIDKKSVITVPIEREMNSLIDALSFADEFVYDDEEIVIIDAGNFSDFDFQDFFRHAKGKHAFCKNSCYYFSSWMLFKKCAGKAMKKSQSVSIDDILEEVNVVS